MNKKIKKKSEVYLSALLIVGILAVANFLSYQILLGLSWDLTQNKDYSISDVTKGTVRNLDDIVNIKAYFSKNLPSEFITLKQNVQDIVDGYVSYSGGKIKSEFIDPAEVDGLGQKLLYQGIPELQFEVYKNDQLQLMKGYLGMTIEYGDKSEAIPVIRDTNSLEYQITLAVKKLTAEDMSVLGYVTSNGVKNEQTIEAGYKKLSELYEIRQVDLEKVEEIDSVIKTLVIVGPTDVFSEDQLKRIDSFVMRGGSLLVLIDGVKLEEGLQAVKNETGIEKLLDSYGMKVNNDLVVETKQNSGIASFNQGFFTFSTNYPLWPKVSKDGFDQENTAVSKIESIVLPWASSISIDETKISEVARISLLAQSSEGAWKQVDNFSLNPQQIFAPSGGIGKNNLAVDVQGKFVSPYGTENLSVSRIIVVGDSDFITGQLAGNGDNLVFFQNLIDTLSLDDDLIAIRSKGISDRPINPELSDGSKSALRYLNIFGVTVIVVAFGLMRYYLRRKSRFVDDL